MYKDIFGENPQTKILDFLADHPNYDYSISELVEKSGISRPTTYKVIENLLQKNLIIKSRIIGNTPVYRLNMENKLVILMLKFDFEISKQMADLESQGIINKYEIKSTVP